MKQKTINVLSGIAFYSLYVTGLLWIAHKFIDAYESTKVNTDLPEPTETKERISKTTYPDNPTHNENEWYQYINRQLN